MEQTRDDRAGVARSWIFGLNLLIACAAQIAATLALIDELARGAPLQ